jgi:hypothetical protein
MPFIVANVSPDLARTNQLLERIALALERLIPEPEDTEILEAVVDDFEAEKKDESEGLKDPEEVDK